MKMKSSFGAWFKEISDSLQKSKSLKPLNEEFNKQTTDHGRVTLLSKHKHLTPLIDPVHNAKSNEKSEQYRTAGNKQYSKKENDAALASYSTSIQYGEVGSKALALAYANRSVVLHAIGEYKLCECDIDLAFKAGYPKNLHYKLFERLGRCLKATGQTTLALNAFKTALSSLGDADLEVKKKNVLAHTFSELCKECEGNAVPNIQTLMCDFDNHKYKVDPPIIPESDVNSVYPCASKAFAIVDDEVGGRHAIATRDIPVGETIIVEKAFTSICLPECLATHCYQCLTRFKVSFPCRCCASVRYCSQECESMSWNDFHQYECQYLDLLTHEDLGLVHLAMKMIIQVGVEGLSHFEQRNNEIIPGGLGTNEEGIYDPSDYLCLYSLVGNSELRSTSDLFRRSMQAIYVCNILVQTGFIADNVPGQYCLVAAHILKQIQMLPCNAHEVSELQVHVEPGEFGVNADFANSVLKEMASAAYTTLSLLNHSCDPSVVRHCYGDTCVLRSIKYIRAGEPIIDNYGHLYPVEVKEDRLKNLKEQYYFDCACIACEKDWPLYSDISKEVSKFHFLFDTI